MDAHNNAPEIIITGNSGTSYLVGQQIAEGSFSKVYICEALGIGIPDSNLVVKIMKMHSPLTEIELTKKISDKKYRGFPDFQDWG
jgi:hypothetical protein